MSNSATNSDRSASIPWVSGRSRADLIALFATLIVYGDFSAIFVASDYLPLNFEEGTTELTKPISSALLAGIISPVRINSMAWPYPTIFVSR